MTAETENRARLFFRDIELGEIVEEDADFPRLFGKFRPIPSATDSPLRREVQKYIEYSIAVDKIMREESSERWDAFVEENEMQFIDFIESEEWYLKYTDRIQLIMIPIFCQDNGIVWRWNFPPDSKDALFNAQSHFANFSASLLQLPLF